MTADKLISLAEKSAPAVMAKTAQVVQMLERLAPDFVPDVISDFKIVTDHTTEKVAGLKDSALGLGKEYGAKAGLALAGALGTAIAADLYDAARRGLTKGMAYNRIMKANPNLKSRVEDPSRIKPSFDALHRYAPEFMADPIMGGALLVQMANQMPGNEHVMLDGLISNRKNYLETKNRQFQPKFDDYFKTKSRSDDKVLSAKDSKKPGE